MRAVLLVSLLMIAGCGHEMNDAERKAKEDADNAFVEGLQGAKPPPQPIELRPIGAPEMEQYQITGARCAFAPGKSLGAVVIAEDDTAWMKIESKMVRLAADKGGAEMPMGTFSHYDGKKYALDLSIDRAELTQNGTETVRYPGALEVRDPYGQLVYRSDGTVECSA